MSFSGVFQANAFELPGKSPPLRINAQESLPLKFLQGNELYQDWGDLGYLGKGNTEVVETYLLENPACYLFPLSSRNRS